MQSARSKLTWLAAAAFAMAASAAQAAPMTGSLGLSDTTLGALNVSLTTISSTSPGIKVVENGWGDFTGFTGFGLAGLVADPASKAVKYMHFHGGFRLDTPARLPNGKKSAASTGGWLEISGLNVDFANGQITGAVNGANGVGSLAQVSLWRFNTPNGLPQGTFDPLMPFHEYQTAGCSGPMPSTCVNTISLTGLQRSDTGALMLTEQGFNVMAMSLGMTTAPLGVPLLQSIGEFGTFSVTAVPEPSAWAMVMVGAVCVVGLRRHARRDQAA